MCGEDKQNEGLLMKVLVTKNKKKNRIIYFHPYRIEWRTYKTKNHIIPIKYEK